MPLTIARPSIVGHTRLGCQPSSSIFWVFGMALMLRKFMCSLEDNIDVIPADYCADALVMLMNSETLENDVSHLRRRGEQRQLCRNRQRHGGGAGKGAGG